MSDIDRHLRHVDRVPVPDLWEGIETRDVRPTLPPARHGRVATVVVALVVAVAGIVLVARVFPLSSNRNLTAAGVGGSDVLQVPPRGKALPEFLTDGRPVWIVHHQDDSVSVIDGFSTHRPFGIEELVGWCASGERFQEPAHGASFNEYGQYLDGPAQADLAHFEFERTDGHVRVGRMVVLDARTDQPAVRPDEPLCSAPGAFPLTPPLEVHHIPTSAEYESPAAAVRAGPDGWVAVRGELWIRRGEPVLLCGTFHATLEETACGSEALVEGVRGDELLEFNQLPELSLEGQWIARVDGNRITDLTDIDRPAEERANRPSVAGACIHVGPGKAIASWKVTKASIPEEAGALAEGDRWVTITLSDGEEFSTGAPPPGVPITVKMDGEWVAVGFAGKDMACGEQQPPAT